MKLLMIIPKYTYNHLAPDRNYHYVFPIGLGYIGAVLKKAGYNLDYLNLNHLDGSIENLINQKLNSEKYDFILLGHMALGYEIVEKIINIVKSHHSKPIVILGGPIITSEPKLMTQSLNFDVGVIGEGELTILELMKALINKKSLENIKGICYKDKQGDIQINEIRKSIEDLDKILFPDFESMGLAEQLDNMAGNDALLNAFDNPRLYHLLGSRGCPFNCTFCYHAVGDRRYRTRSIKNVMEEIKYAIKKFNINCVYINDDMFASNKQRFHEFCKEIQKIFKSSNGNFRWACSAPVTAIDEETVELLKESGCYYIGFGFESYSQKVLRSMKKPITPQQIDSAIKICLKLKMPVVGNFIFGDVAETFETAKETLEYWKNNTQGQVKLFFIQPYPGSEIYQHCINKGIIKDKLDYIKNHMPHTNFFNMTNSLSDKQYQDLVKLICEYRNIGTKHIIPQKVITEKDDRCTVKVKCPFCSEIIEYKNCLISNKKYFLMQVICRNPECCKMFFIASRLYKFSIEHYKKLDFFRRNFLRIRNNLLSKRL